MRTNRLSKGLLLVVVLVIVWFYFLKNESYPSSDAATQYAQWYPQTNLTDKPREQVVVNKLPLPAVPVTDGEPSESSNDLMNKYLNGIRLKIAETSKKYKKQLSSTGQNIDASKKNERSSGLLDADSTEHLRSPHKHRMQKNEEPPVSNQQREGTRFDRGSALLISKADAGSLPNIVPSPRPRFALTGDGPSLSDSSTKAVISDTSLSDNLPWLEVPGINCELLFKDDALEQSKARLHQQQYRKQPIPDELYTNVGMNCSKFHALRRYIMQPLSLEEELFPIAFSILIFKDIEQFERLLRAIYHAQNFYCIHVDLNSPTVIHKATQAIASCFDNVFIAPRLVRVEWGRFSTVEPELICMEALLQRSKKWRYFINLTGQEFPLKTNLDIVRILKVFNGANNLEGTVKRRDDTRFTAQPPLPFNLQLTKGSVHITASREFVNFIIYNETSLQFREWVKNTYIPDETYFATLNFNPKLGAPGAFLGWPETDTHKNLFITRFKNWGDGPFNWPCYGHRVRYVCVFGIGDLPLLASRPELFANKFYLEYEPLALDCLEQLHFSRIRDEFSGIRTFNTSFYEDLAFVKNHQ